MKYEQFLTDVGKTRDEVEGMGRALSRIKSVLSAAHDLVGKNERLEKENRELKGENARLKAELDDWKGNAEGFQPDAYMKLPLDADGVPIRLGDTVWYIGIDVGIEKDYPLKVDGFVRMPDVLETFIETRECPRKAIATESLTHKKPEPADSWEKLEEDARRTPCDYACAPLDSDGLTTCNGCRLCKSESCYAEMTLEVLERAKKLAGIEELEGGER